LEGRKRVPVWGMTIDLDLCTGCQTCVLACRAENNSPAVGQADAEMGRDLAWIAMVIAEDQRESAQPRLLPMPCLHCDEPPCAKVCPVGATYRDRDGIVAQIYDQCIGCRLCMAACPYNAKRFNWRSYAVSGPGQTPEVSLRPKGVVEKCTFCHHRLQQARTNAIAEGRALKALAYVPACVEVCPAGALSFGDLSDLESVVARLSRSPRAFRLLAHLGTRPKVVYLGERSLRELVR